MRTQINFFWKGYKSVGVAITDGAVPRVGDVVEIELKCNLGHRDRFEVLEVCWRLLMADPEQGVPMNHVFVTVKRL